MTFLKKSKGGFQSENCCTGDGRLNTPFNSLASFNASTAPLSVTILDVTGQIVVESVLAPGQSTWRWKAQTARTGLYFVQVTGQGGVQVLPVTLLR